MANVLVVDDAAFMRLTLKGTLEKLGHKVVAEAPDGDVAIEMYKKHNPDIVTMDITMPNKNGIEAVQGIIAFDPNAKIVMCSAMGQQAMVMEAIKSGAKDFLVKPFNEDRIKESFSKVGV